MTCTNPVRIRAKAKPFSFNAYGDVLTVPCGKCVSCRIRRTAEWTKRILDEAEGKPSCFITLTYDDIHLPKDLSLNAKHLQNFWKRMRKKHANLKIKYYACGEYGDSQQRPHYHAIVIGWKPELNNLLFISKNIVTCKELTELWPMGFSTVGNLTKESAQYVTGYIRKKLYGKENNYGNRKPPFACSSLGIGLSYAQKNWKRIMKGETVNGQNLGIPRYYLKKIASKKDKEDLMDKALDATQEMINKFDSFELYEKALWLDRERRHAENLSKEQLFNERKKI